MRQSRSCFRLLILIALCLSAISHASAQEGRPIEQKVENPIESTKPTQQAPAVTAAPAATGSLKGGVASAGLAVGPALQLRRPEIRVRESGAGVAH